MLYSVADKCAACAYDKEKKMKMERKTLRLILAASYRAEFSVLSISCAFQRVHFQRALNV